MASKNSDRSLANLTALADHQRCLMLHSIDSTVLAASPRPARVVAIDDTAKIIKDVMRVNALLGDIFDLTATPVERIRGIVHCAIDEGLGKPWPWGGDVSLNVLWRYMQRSYKLEPFEGQCATVLILSLLRHTKNESDIHFPELDCIAGQLTSLSTYNWLKSGDATFATIAIHCEAAQRLSFLLQQVLYDPEVPFELHTDRIKTPWITTYRPYSAEEYLVDSTTAGWKESRALGWIKGAKDIPLRGLFVMNHVYAAVRKAFDVMQVKPGLAVYPGSIKSFNNVLLGSLESEVARGLEQDAAEEARVGVILSAWVARLLAKPDRNPPAGDICAVLEPPETVMNALEHVASLMSRWFDRPLNPFILQGARLATAVSIRRLDQHRAAKCRGCEEWNVYNSFKPKLDHYQHCFETKGV